MNWWVFVAWLIPTGLFSVYLIRSDTVAFRIKSCWLGYVFIVVGVIGGLFYGT